MGVWSRLMRRRNFFRGNDMPGHVWRHCAVSRLSKMAEPIKMPFRLWTRVALRTMYYMWVQVAPREGAIFRGKDVPGHAWRHSTMKFFLPKLRSLLACVLNDLFTGSLLTDKLSICVNKYCHCIWRTLFPLSLYIIHVLYKLRVFVVKLVKFFSFFAIGFHSSE